MALPMNVLKFQMYVYIYSGYLEFQNLEERKIGKMEREKEKRTFFQFLHFSFKLFYFLWLLHQGYFTLNLSNYKI